MTSSIFDMFDMSGTTIILDDERRWVDITWVELPFSLCSYARTPKEFIRLVVKSELITWVSFDHDLAWYNNQGKDVTGYDCLKWLCRHLDRNPSKPIPKAYFHSKNPVGVDNMRNYWDNWLNTQPEWRVRL